jgi:hypothetical protein
MAIKLTEEFIRTMPTGKRVLDTATKGLGVYRGKERTSFFIQTDIYPSAGPKRSVRSVFCPDVREMPLREARRKARRLIDDLRGEPSKTRGSTLAGVVTVRRAFAVYDDYLRKKGRSAQHIRETAATVDRYFADWADRRLVSITKHECEKRHAEITKRPAPMAANAAMLALGSVFRHIARKDHTGTMSGVDCPVDAVDFNSKPRGVEKPTLSPADLPEWWAAVWSLSNPTRSAMHSFVLLTGMRYANASKITRDMIKGDWVECPAAIMKSRRPWRFPITKQLGQVIDEALAHSPHDLLFWTYSAKQPGKVIAIPNYREKEPFLATRLGHKTRRHYRTAVELCEVPATYADLLLDHAPQIVMAGMYINNRDLDDRLRSFAQRVEASITITFL